MGLLKVSLRLSLDMTYLVINYEGINTLRSYLESSKDIYR